MSLTSLGDRKTPSRPVEIAFAPETGLPSDSKEIILIGHRGDGAASGSSGVVNYTVVAINNVADEAAASGEVVTKFGDGSELAKMVLAAVRVNAAGGVHPAIKCIPLAYSETGFGSSDEALTAAKAVKGEYLVSCYDGADPTLRDKLEAAAEVMSGPERTENNQFGTHGVVFNRSVTDPSNLPSPDSQYLTAHWMPDTGTGDEAPEYSVAEMAAACAAGCAANIAPFNPLDNVTLDDVPAPAKSTDWITVGAGLMSETALEKGWSPLRVKPNGEVAFVRTVTTRITIDGFTEATAYYDEQDFDVLYFWRKTIYTRAKQPDFMNVKATIEKARELKAEMIRLANVFEDQGMFQQVARLAPDFAVERDTSDRHTFQVLTPVNVVPGLHNILTRVEATTQYDSFTV